MAASLPVSWLPFKYPFRQLGNCWFNRMRPRIAETKFGSGFFSGDFRWGFNGGTQRITQRAGIFPVGVVNPPELIVRLQNSGRAHGLHFSKTM